ncbi:uncharacterized protein SCO4629-like [Tachypleus tridentatus]|uniref:uncharacterized protein SCO4629-like n=1 Tax=Tachypleus tridentatus TaxID=6853 RepID=UPI003FD584E7
MMLRRETPQDAIDTVMEGENRQESLSANLKLEELVSDEDLIHAKTLWEYLLFHHDFKKSDVILLLGNNDIRTAEYAGSLYLKGYGDWLVISGKAGNMTKGKWTRPEAYVFRDVALDIGVPENRIIIESQATNTGENVKFSYKIMKKYNINPSSIILVHTPYMERRTYATFMKQWPGNVTSLRVMVTSPPITLLHYPTRAVGTMREILAAMLGTFQRIKIYPHTGFQVHQNINSEVNEAFEALVKTGRYNDYIIST